MTMGFDDLIVGGQLRVGTGYCAPIKEGDFKINGSAHMEGPVVIGLGSKIKLGAKGGDPDDPEDNTGTAPANLMITRNYNKDKDCFSGAIKRTLLTEGNVQINGDDGTPNALVLNGNIDICATNGKIRLQATDIELIAVGEGGSKGHIKCTATETFSVYETKKIILDSKSLTKITSTGSINIAANTMMKIYGSLIKAVTDASAVKNSKTNGQNDVVSNNVVESSSEGD